MTLTLDLFIYEYQLQFYISQYTFETFNSSDPGNNNALFKLNRNANAVLSKSAKIKQMQPLWATLVCQISFSGALYGLLYSPKFLMINIPNISYKMRRNGGGSIIRRITSQFKAVETIIFCIIFHKVGLNNLQI